jgi:hypothetical protein
MRGEHCQIPSPVLTAHLKGLTTDQDVSRGALPKAVIQPKAPLMRGKLGDLMCKLNCAADLWITVVALRRQRLPNTKVCLRVLSDQGLYQKYMKRNVPDVLMSISLSW